MNQTKASKSVQKTEYMNRFFSFLGKIKKYYFKSLKPFQAEELVSFIFIRPIGFLIAMLSKAMRISPNMLSVVRGGTAFVGGIFFIMGTPQSIWTGAVIFLISNFFDSSDGQLARIIEKPTELGLILDGIGDGISMAGIYVGTAIALFRNNPETGPYYWLLSFIAFICFFIFIYTQGFLRYELFLYMERSSAKPRNTLSDIKKKLQSGKSGKEKLILRFMIFFNTCLELIANIVLIKQYKGYFNWYKNSQSVSPEKKELFKINYKKNNGWILLLFNNVAILSNQIIFIICGLLNRLDFALYIILVGCNLYYITIVIIQRISFKIQIDKIK